MKSVLAEDVVLVAASGAALAVGVASDSDSDADSDPYMSVQCDCSAPDPSSCAHGLDHSILLHILSPPSRTPVSACSPS